MDIMHLLFSFQGRIRRQHFWMGLIGVVVVFSIIVGVLMGMSGLAQGSANPIVLIILAVVYVAYIWMALAIDVKRCHDRDKSGWFILIGLIPLIGGIWLLVELGFLDGTQGPNRFGPSPKGIGGDQPTAVAA